MEQKKILTPLTIDTLPMFKPLSYDAKFPKSTVFPLDKFYPQQNQVRKASEVRPFPPLLSALNYPN